MTTAIDIRQTFFQECEELLETLDDGLVALSSMSEDQDIDPETVNAVFRAVHSIKGGAAAFGLEALVRFAHQFETALDDVRAGRLSPTGDHVRVFQRSADYLADLVVGARDSVEPKPGIGADLSNRLAQLSSEGKGGTNIPTAPTHGPLEENIGFQPVSIAFDFGPIADVPLTYRINIAPTRQFYAIGNDPSPIFRALEALGEIGVEADFSGLPPLDEMDWSEPYISWAITLRTSEPLATVQELFEFVDGLCLLEIAEIQDDAGQLPPAVQRGPADPPDPVPALTLQPEDLVRSMPEMPDGAVKPRKAGASSGTSQKGSVRVDLDHVDRLINIVGELVINQAVLAQCAQDAGLGSQSDVGVGLDEFRNLARELQEHVMAIRAQSVKQLFQRMARIVREASDIAGKAVAFDTEGEAVEVDKTVIERLVDPLTHILRNAVDHGLEASAARIAAGKPAAGRVRLSAAHRSGRVLIEVSDDGAGINRPKVKQIAIDKGLIPQDAVLDDAAIDKLLFLPGFSTADKVTDLSGRGVGMDVVRSAIQNLGGRVTIASVPGKGTTFSISLPLTLAVLDGMVVDVAGQTMVVPITAIIETLRPSAVDIHHLASAGLVVAVRQTFVPIIDLAEAFGHRTAASDYSNMVLLLVETAQNERWALAVDRIHDQRQVVIKGLEANYGHVPGVAAATILGDGKIALIIDPDETAQCRLRQRATVRPKATEEV